MAIKPDSSVDPQQLKSQIALATANGGIYAVETTKDIYITEVTENVTKASVNSVVNNPSGTLGGEIQLFDGKGFGSTSNLRYTDALGLSLDGNMSMTGNLNLTGSIVSSGLLNLGAPGMVTITGGNPGDILTTDGQGNLSWSYAGGATYGNATVAAYLPTNTANIAAGNASLGNLVTANYYAGTLVTPSQPNITQVGTLTSLAVSGSVVTGPLGTNGPIMATGNIMGANISTTGNITGLNMSINNITSSGNLTVTKSIIAANITGTHFGDGGNLTNINAANLIGPVANAAHALVADTAYSVDGANVNGSVANAVYADAAGMALSVPASGVVGTVASATVAASANSVAGANVSGAVAFATVANSVAGANVIGAVAFATTANSVAGANVAGAVALATSATTANSVAGANVVGQVASALVAATVSSAAQPNITSVGTLTGVTVNGAADFNSSVDLGDVGNVLIAGGTAGQVLMTDGAGHLSWANGGSGGNGGGTTYILPTASTTVLGGVKVDGTTVTISPSGIISAAAGSLTGDAGNLSNIQGANVVGAVALATSATTATTANSVAGANVTGAVSFATTANSVAGANVVGAVALATTATTAITATTAGSATTANSVAGANVTGAVSFATTANSVAGANVTGEVAFAATANAVAGANVAGAVALATAATTAATVTANAQPNITSVGTLTDLTVSGDVAMGDTVNPGATFMTLDSTGISLGQTGGQIISASATNGINIAGTGGVTIQGVLGSNIDIGGGTGGNINVSSPLVVPVGSLKVSGGNAGEVLSTDGSGGLSWATAALANRIESGTSSVDIPTADGNVVVTSGANSWQFADSGKLVLPGANYTASSPVSLRAEYGFVIHPSHNTGGTGPELAINYNDGIEITPYTNDYLAGGTTAAPLYVQGAYSTTATVVPGSVIITPGRNTTDGTYGGVTIGETAGGTVTLRGASVNLGAVGNLHITGGTLGQVLTTNGTGGLSWESTAATYSNADVANYLPTYTGNVGASNIVFTGSTSLIESPGTIAILPGMTVDLGSTRLMSDITPVNAQGGNVGTAILPFFDGHFVNLHADNVLGDGGNLANIQGANVTGEVAFAATANTVAGANVTGWVANANIANSSLLAETVTTNAQPNITSVGTLTALETSGDITVGGNLIVNGTTTTVNSTTVDIGDTNITLAANATTAAMANGGGITLAGAAATIVYTSADDSWNFNKNIVGNIANANAANFAGNVTVNAQPNITSVGTLTSLAVSGDITTAGGASPAPAISGFSSVGAENLTITKISTLGNVGNVKITGGTTGQFMTTDGTGNLSWTTSVSTTLKYTREIHVDSTLGNDTTGDGSYNKPYATIMKAHSVVTSGFTVFLHVGGYSETVAWTKTNCDIIGLSAGGMVNVTGAWTVGTTTGASIRIKDIAFNNTFTQNSTGRIIFQSCYLRSTFTRTSGEYTQFDDTDAAGTGIAINSAGTVVFNGGSQTGLTVNHASAVVSVNNSIACAIVTVLAGTVVLNDSYVYSAAATTAAVTSSAGSIVYLYNAHCGTPAGTIARLSLAGFWTTGGSQYDTANSTLTGTNMGTISYFDGVTTVGNVRAGNMVSLGTVTATGNVAGGNITTGAQVVATGNVTGGNLRTAGALSVTGNANIGNIGTASLIATANITASGVFTGNGAGLTNIVGANNANFAGNVTVAAQPNITSVGTLTSLAVAGNISGGNIAITSNIAASNLALNGQITTPNITVTNRATLGSVSNVRITGGNATEFLTTDGLGNLSWASPLPVIEDNTVTANLDFYPLFAIANSGPMANVYASSSNFKFNPNTGMLTTGGLIMSQIEANEANITTVRASTVSGSAINGTTITVGTNLLTSVVTAKTSSIEIKSNAAGDINFTTSGNVQMTNPTLLKNLLDPDQPQDAATKHYVDAIAQGLNPLATVKAATTGTLASITGGAVTYDNGVAGVGATLTLSTALTTLDGVALTAGSRVFVHLEADQSHNGVYTYTSGTVLTRATDSDDATKLLKGSYCYIASGTLYGKVGFAQTSVVTTVGTDPVTYVQFSAAPDYIAGAGIYITGAEIKVDNTGVAAGSYGSGGAIPVLNINSRGQIVSASTSGISAPAGGLTGNRIHSNVFYSNLHTVGTLENLTVSGDSTLAGNILSFGNVTVANADLGNLATANFFQGDGGLLTNISLSLTSIEDGTSQVIVDPNAAVRTIINGNPVSSVNASGLDITGAITATTSVTAVDFIGLASSANTAATALQVTDATQSNITQVGTLTSLTVSGVTTLGNVGNVKITGGTNGQILRTDGTGNLVWATITATTAATVTTNAQPNITSVGTLTSLAVTGNITGANITGAHYGAGNNLSNIQGANVVGSVAQAAVASVANSIIGANVSGQVANALVAGTVYTNAQPNITSVGTLTSLAVTGTSTLGDVANITIDGGTLGQMLTTDGAGNLTWSTASVTSINNGTSEVNIPSSGGYVYLTANGSSWEVSDTMITSPDLQFTIWQDGTIQSAANKLWMRSMTSEVALISADGLGNSATVSALHDTGIRLSMQKDGSTVSTMTLDRDGNLAVPGSLKPTTDGIADLGADMIGRWGNLYLKEKIRLGFTEIQAVPLENEISINGNLSAFNIFGAANLTTLEVGASANLGEVGNVTITGGASGQVLTTNGSGALSWTFPRLPNFADDTAANTALGGTPSTGMMFFDTTLDTIKVYKSTGWTAI